MKTYPASEKNKIEDQGYPNVLIQIQRLDIYRLPSRIWTKWVSDGSGSRRFIRSWIRIYSVTDPHSGSGALVPGCERYSKYNLMNFPNSFASLLFGFHTFGVRRPIDDPNP